MNARAAFFKKPFTFIYLFSKTFKDPRRMPVSKRDLLRDRIIQFSKHLGLKTKASEKVLLTSDSLCQVPRSSGVYRIYRDNEIQYIGKSFNIQERVSEHLKGSHSQDLQELIESQEAYIEWIEVLFPGWVECYEHIAFEELTGSLPLLNKKKCGNFLE